MEKVNVAPLWSLLVRFGCLVMQAYWVASVDRFPAPKIDPRHMGNRSFLWKVFCKHYFHLFRTKRTDHSRASPAERSEPGRSSRQAKASFVHSI
ncbi:hypothetical protein JB92DRAFT_2894348 [Gautieria morchelliformis]|nr:hypothetical protein JB92DRAFT_2894348 [Gautieria morchelliformis]